MVEPIVDTTEGKVRGNIRKNIDGEEFLCFLGIPYAQPPLGELRFKAPEPAEPWSGIKDATKEGKRIFQRDSLYRSISGTEDGLHLNVFTKKSFTQNTKLNKPVMVWIHSGAFLEGSNSTEIYGPEFLMTEDILLVSINYRLGLLGLLQLEDPSLEIFGNASIKDQIAALKWVQRNIQNFGGDPNNVTIFGESAGAGSVHYLILSPSAKGLFHKAICQSGVTMNDWAVGKPFAKDFLTYIGKKDMSEKEALIYLRSLKVEELFNLQESYFKSLPTGAMGVLSPIPEQPNPTAVITKHPVEYLSSGDYNKVPILMGYNSNECSFFSSSIAQTNDMVKMVGKLSPENIVSQILNIDQESDVCKNLSNKLKSVYKSTKDGKYMFASDLVFIINIINCARKHARMSDKPVFLYRMSLDAGLNMMKKLLMVNGPGAVHFDDVGYLFKTSLKVPQRGSSDDTYLRRFIKLWTNFAKYGDPTPEGNDLGIIWKPFNEDSEYYLDINTELIIKTGPEKERVKVWREIYQAGPLTAKLL